MLPPNASQHVQAAGQQLSIAHAAFADNAVTEDLPAILGHMPLAAEVGIVVLSQCPNDGRELFKFDGSLLGTSAFLSWLPPVCNPVRTVLMGLCRIAVATLRVLNLLADRKTIIMPYTHEASNSLPVTLTSRCLPLIAFSISLLVYDR